MDQQTKGTIFELYDAAKDKEDQIKLMKELGFGTRSEILKVLHEAGKALNIPIRKKREDTMAAEEQNAWIENKKEISQELKEYFITDLEKLETKIKEIEADITDLNFQIQADLEDKRKLEKIYKELFELTKKRSEGPKKEFITVKTL